MIENIDLFNDYEHIRLTLIGHANEVRIKEDQIHIYRSNYELSQARAHAVHFALIEKLEIYMKEEKKKNLDNSSSEYKKRWHNIEWFLIPVSNEKRFLEEPKEKPEWLSVEVSITPIHEHLTQLQMKAITKSVPESPTLELLDYVYFTIYTITTTGYGDIIPVTGLAKFIASLANLFEVFFFVIFFNVLLSHKGAAPLG